MFTANVGMIDRGLRAAVSFCPAYRLMGMNTCGRQ